MTGITTDDLIEDIEECARSGRMPREGARYKIMIGDEQFDYQPAILDDPCPTGRQILDSAKLRPAEEFILLQMLFDGMLEELRHDETTDLRAKGVERFLYFRNDRSFRLQLDGRIFEWGAALISGATLKKLAEVDAATHSVYLEAKKVGDKLIDDNELVDLSNAGVERFYTRQETYEIEVMVNEWPVKLVGRKHNGLEIKQAAIKQGIQIKPDFLLSRERGPGRTELIGNDQIIKVRPGDKFIAIADDDNS